MTTKNESALERFRRIEAKVAEQQPPTESESWDYIHVLTSTNAPVKTRRFSGIFWWVLVFLTFAWLSGAVFEASYAAAQSPAANDCIMALVEDINPSLMSRTTAVRKARAICYDLRYSDRDFYKALTQ